MLSFVYTIWSLLTTIAMISAVVIGVALAVVLALRRVLQNRLSDFLLAGLLFTLSLTELQRLFIWLQIKNLDIIFLPIYCSFAFAPLIFFMVKSRLYPNFRLQQNDIKHFILPIVQIVVMSWIFLQPAHTRTWVASGGFFTPFYGNFERGVYLVQFGLYLYFSYRFILHERTPLSSHSPKHQILLTGWLKRMVKAAFIIFVIEASFVLTDYFSMRWFDVDLRSRLFFSSVLELSFTAQLWWLIINTLFALKKYI
jgi:hypothetical protein